MSHRNARLTVPGRRLLIQRLLSGRLVAHVAEGMGISRATAHKWVRRWRTEGDRGLFDEPATTIGRPPPTCARAASQ
ncbi:leucine zipper domain-containing protein [Streptomyces lydicus]|uniref:leucine zipper domain-containing protein n=1 Tax=Streptomyces lydicus TaxID=47763 RepID=UPI0009820249|nr:leucine zipper domain-containing protein [Streptomyces lydicus]